MASQRVAIAMRIFSDKPRRWFFGSQRPVATDKPVCAAKSSWLIGAPNSPRRTRSLRNGVLRRSTGVEGIASHILYSAIELCNSCDLCTHKEFCCAASCLLLQFQHGPNEYETDKHGANIHPQDRCRGHGGMPNVWALIIGRFTITSIEALSRITSSRAFC